MQAAIGPGLGPKDVSNVSLNRRGGRPKKPAGEGLEGAPAVALVKEAGAAGEGQSQSEEGG